MALGQTIHSSGIDPAKADAHETKRKKRQVHMENLLQRIVMCECLVVGLSLEIE